MVRRCYSPCLGIFVLAAGALFCAVDSSAADYVPRVGDYHPEVTLPRIDASGPVSLSDFRGKKVLLIHFASW